MPLIQVCSDCFGDGWGPMLRDIVWNTIKPPVFTMYILPSQPDLVRWGRFLCEPCDCPMNFNHPAYEPHEMKKHLEASAEDHRICNTMFTLLDSMDLL